VAVGVRLDGFPLIKQLPPSAQFLDVRLARYPLEAVLVSDVVYSDLRPFLGPPIRNIDEGVKTGSVQIDAQIERFQRLFRRHSEPLGARVLIAAGFSDDDRAAVTVPSQFEQLAKRLPPRIARAEYLPLLVGIQLDFAVVIETHADDIEDFG